MQAMVINQTQQQQRRAGGVERQRTLSDTSLFTTLAALDARPAERRLAAAYTTTF